MPKQPNLFRCARALAAHAYSSSYEAICAFFKEEEMCAQLCLVILVRSVLEYKYSKYMPLLS
jgi:hypothetical protein